MTQTYDPRPTMVAVTTSLIVADSSLCSPFTTPIRTDLTLPTANASYFTTWGSGCVSNYGSISQLCYSVGR